MDWFETEPKLRTAGWAATKRLLRRALSSWPVWLLGAFAVSGVVTVRQSRVKHVYDASVVLRVTEGQVEIPGSELGAGTLRAHLEELVFTNARLKEVMKRHPDRFDDPDRDPAAALESFRDMLAINVTENDFTEDRGKDDPPRSARVQITFSSIDPKTALTVARELGDLVMGSTIGRQKETLERQQAAALTAASKADKEYSEALRADPTLQQFFTRAARDRAVATKQRLTASMLAMRALGEKQSLRFDVVDNGEIPARIDPRSALAVAFLGTLFAALLGGMLLAGAFDPRVLDAQDLATLGVPALGHLPPLPRASGAGGGGQ